MRIINELSGYSGCKVLLCQADDDSSMFVRKISSSAEYNKRLLAQAQKQEVFLNDSQAPFRVPRIINHGELDGIYFFDMEYINGQTLINHIPNSIESDSHINSLSSIIDFFSEKKQSNHLKWSLFHDTLDKLNSVVNSVQFDSQIVNRMFSFLISKRNDFDQISTFCHGDLTLENIIVSDTGEYVLYDFLDNFSNHFWFDIAKIYQDLEGGWYNLKNNKLIISPIKLNTFGERLKKELNTVYPNYFEVHYFLLSLCFMRIVPYATDSKLRTQILSRVNFFTDKL